MRAARFEVSVELIGEVMHMPPLSRIVQASMSDDGRSVVFTVTDPALPKSTDAHNAVPTVTKESYRWDWNVAQADDSSSQAIR